jgi:hypothetical protein
VLKVRTALFAAWLSLSAATASADTPRTRCDFYRAYACQAAGCRDATSKAWSIIDWDRKDYAFCDDNGCHHAAFQDWPDGIYRSLGFVGTDLMVKINLTDQSIVETGSFLNVTVTSFGNCARMP